MDAVTRRWVDAASLLSADRKATVPCPECGKDSMRAEEIALPNGAVVELRLHCDGCGAQNFLLLGPKARGQ